MCPYLFLNLLLSFDNSVLVNSPKVCIYQEHLASLFNLFDFMLHLTHKLIIVK